MCVSRYMSRGVCVCVMHLYYKTSLKHCPGTMQGMAYKSKEREDIGILCRRQYHLLQLPHRWGLP